MVKIWIWTLILAITGLALFLIGILLGTQTMTGTALSMTGITLIIVSSLVRLVVKLRRSKKI